MVAVFNVILMLELRIRMLRFDQYGIVDRHANILLIKHTVCQDFRRGGTRFSQEAKAVL
jgi:hypothetical protein